MIQGKCEESVFRNNFSPASHLSLQVLTIFQHPVGLAGGCRHRHSLHVRRQSTLSARFVPISVKGTNNCIYSYRTVLVILSLKALDTNPDTPTASGRSPNFWVTQFPHTASSRGIVSTVSSSQQTLHTAKAGAALR